MHINKSGKSFIFILSTTTHYEMKGVTMNNEFINQFSENIKFGYASFDRVIIRGCIRKFFSLRFIVTLIKSMGFSKSTKGVLRIFTDQLNANINKQAPRDNVPILWWNQWCKLQYVEKHYSKKFTGKENHVFCIITDKEPVKTVSSKEIKSKIGRFFTKLFNVRRPVKQYYIYFYDVVLGGTLLFKNIFISAVSK